jgi:glycosyltransferase involved in cell wall biosynthesis
MNKIFLSIVIPSYNEIVNLRKGVLDKIKNFADKQGFSYEVIIVDDGSDDGSLEFVLKFAKENKNFLVLKNPHLGKAGAVTTGMLCAKGEFVLFTDMDQATPISEIEKLLPFVKKGFDVVIGSRNTTRKGAPFTRKIMAKGMIILRSLLVGLPWIQDTQCGFKLFKKDAAQKIFKKIKDIHRGFKSINGSSVSAGFDVEILYLANLCGYKIKEVPVEWLYVETRRVSPLKDSLEGFFDLLRIRYNILKGVYK